ncbi:MAG: DUF4349 domain-containing protein [Chloroflexota bacterium]
MHASPRRFTSSGAAFLLAGCALLVAVALGGCSTASSRDAGMSTAPGAPAVAPAPSTQTKESDGGGAASPGVAGAPIAPTTGALPSVGAPRQIVRTAAADLEVRSVAEAFAAVQQIATIANGMVASSSFAGTANSQSAQLSLRVPGDRLDDVIARLRDVAVEVRSITTGSNDVTDEYTDVQATLINLRAVEAQYMTLLARASSISDVLLIQDRLNQVRLQIDRTEARRQSLASQVAMSTVNVTLRPVSGLAASGSMLGQAQAAWRASLNTLSVVATAVVVTAVFFWWLIPLALVVVLVLLVLRRRRGAASRPGEVQS